MQTHEPIYRKAKSLNAAGLQLSQPGDRYEREADAMADSILRGEQVTPSFSAPSQIAQRKCRHCEEEEKKHRVQRKEISHTPVTTSGSFSQHLQSASTQGTPLPAAAMHRMNQSFSTDFSAVRIHTDAKAQQLSRSINANAFTCGTHIFFSQHKFDPSSASGRHLLAHELTHVMQQQRMPNLLQREFAIDTVGSAAERFLSHRETIGALTHNRTMHTNRRLIGFLRDVLGISSTPQVIDEEFVEAVKRFQAFHGITQDGRLGQITTVFLAEELEEEGHSAEADELRRLHRNSVDINTTQCACRDGLRRAITSNNEFITEYRTCGTDATNRTGDDIERCVARAFAARGVRLSTAGSTSATGAITVRRSSTPCGRLLSSDTFHHEWSHETHRRELVERFGAGTPAFNRAFDDATDWVSDEILSRQMENQYLNYIIMRLNQLCP